MSTSRRTVFSTTRSLYHQATLQSDTTPTHLWLREATFFLNHPSALTWPQRACDRAAEFHCWRSNALGRRLSMCAARAKARQAAMLACRWSACGQPSEFDAFLHFQELVSPPCAHILGQSTR
ncbi:unnamed protein product [Prorocentrum cordatum]|uniref:Uncharacterized protein n=1 Tax=Prorocentrum cordatum TaxID=2364126 RepID=A0ABN9SPM7_9DINO|nr:unnamed protein product [Polarella glacialis]